jgi:glucose/arabinose dehydrogenase
MLSYNGVVRRPIVMLLAVAGPFATALASCADDPTLSDASPDATADGTLTLTDAIAIVDEASAGDAADAATDTDAPLVDTCGDAGVVADAWVVDPHLCLTVFADSTTLLTPRQMAFAPNGDLFVENAGDIRALRDANKDGFISTDERTWFVPAGFGLTHGVAFSPDGAFLYASSDRTIFRWAYTSGDRVASAPAQLVVHDMPPAGHHTRTLAFDAQGRMYVNVGSQGDVDQGTDLTSVRAQVRRFTLPSTLPTDGIAYTAGDVFASGLRNEVGLAFDSQGRMWGVENGSDGTYMPPDIGSNNPAEKINRLDAPGPRFYGYPECWTDYGTPSGSGRGTQWAYLTNSKTDAWCRDTSNVQQPAAVMPGHWAPLGIAEYTGGSLPWKGDLFVTSHAAGRLIARAHLERRSL